MGNIIRNLIEFHFLNSMVVFEYIRIIRHIFSILIPAYCFCLTMYVIITIILMKEKNLMDFLQLKAEYEKKSVGVEDLSFQPHTQLFCL